ncbi:hypothetical protein [Marinobacterium jannaschii]|uniref:hypothetical protein n=1 Tax=Marinobacterium jannaschii TaxID=64970 RepID=UPI00047F84E3|nr:hypothetical protein [Marinobacterium jannaschii]
MNRHYYISDNLDDLESLEHELEEHGINIEQIHVLSEKNAEVEQHHLHEVTSLMKNDAVHSGEIGAAIGVLLAAIILGLSWLFGWTDTAVGWMPFIFLAIVVIGFCTWEGGFLGIQMPNSHFQRFKRALKRGKHIFFVDVEPEQEPLLDEIAHHHPMLKDAGTGSAVPHWVVSWLHTWHQFKRTI